MSEPQPGPQVLKQNPSLRRKLWAKRSEPEVILELVIIFLICLELVFSAYFGWEGVKASKEQTELLQGVEDQAQKQAGQQELIFRSIMRMNGVLQSQLDVLEADQKRSIEERELKPRIYLLINGIPLHGQAEQPARPGRISPTKVELMVQIMNVGSLTANSPKLTLIVDDRVTIGGPWPVKQLGQPPRKGRRTLEIEIPMPITLGGTGFSLTAEFPPDVKVFRVSFFFSAATVSRTFMGSIVVSPASERVPDA